MIFTLGADSKMQWFRELENSPEDANIVNYETWRFCLLLAGQKNINLSWMHQGRLRQQSKTDWCYIWPPNYILSLSLSLCVCVCVCVVCRGKENVKLSCNSSYPSWLLLCFMLHTSSCPWLLTAHWQVSKSTKGIVHCNSVYKLLQDQI